MSWLNRFRFYHLRPYDHPISMSSRVEFQADPKLAYAIESARRGWLLAEPVQRKDAPPRLIESQPDTFIIPADIPEDMPIG